MKVRGPIVTLALCATLLLAGCGSNADDASSQPTATVESIPTPTVPAEPTVADIALDVADPVWATGVDPDDGSPLEPVEWYATDTDAVYAVFQTGPIAAGTEFTVGWSMNDTPVPGLDPSLQIRADTPAGWIEFHLDRTSDTPWPDGMLTVELSVAGEVVASGTVELRD